MVRLSIDSIVYVCWGWSALAIVASCFLGKTVINKSFLALHSTPPVDDVRKQLTQNNQLPAFRFIPPADEVREHVSQNNQLLREEFPVAPWNYDLNGKNVAELSCGKGDNRRELVECCQTACAREPACEFWVVQTRSCFLRKDFTGNLTQTIRPSVAVELSGFKNPPASWDTVLGRRPLDEDLEQLKREIAEPCLKVRSKPAGHETVSPREHEHPDMVAWARWALDQMDGYVQAFPQHEVLLSSKTCIDRSEQVKKPIPGGRHGKPWYLLQQSPGKVNDTGQLDLPWETRKNLTCLRWGEAHDQERLRCWEQERAASAFGKADCPDGQSFWTWQSHFPRRSRWRGGAGLPSGGTSAGGPPSPVRGVALADSDVSDNIYHATAHMIFMSMALRIFEQQLGPALGLGPGDLEFVALHYSILGRHREGGTAGRAGHDGEARGRGRGRGRRGPLAFRSRFQRFLAETLGLSEWLRWEETFQEPRGAPPARCYLLVLQRFFMWPTRPWRYRQLRQQMLQRCAQHPGPGGAAAGSAAAAGHPGGRTGGGEAGGSQQPLLCRRMLFWYKRSVGRRQFYNRDTLEQGLRSFASQRRLSLTVTELSGASMLGQAPCQQLALFLHLALFVGVHGAAGVHVLWMPSGALFFEIFPALRASTRTVGQGFYAEPAKLGGRAYVNYGSVAEVGIPKTTGFSEYFALNTSQLLATLHLLFTNWLEVRLLPVAVACTESQ